MSTRQASAESLSRSLAERVSRVLDAARSSPVGGGPDWDAQLESLGVVPMTREERAGFLAESAAQRTGALPLEVRRGLEALVRIVRQAAREVERDDAALDALERELRDLVERELRTFIAFIRPPSGLGSIFQNALATTKRYDQTAARAGALRCTMCGAARRDEAVLVCQFCGTSLYPSEAK